MHRFAHILAIVVLATACSGNDNNGNNGENGGTNNGSTGAVCEDAADLDFGADSGWDSAEYCGVPTDLGCFPWHGSTADECGPFTTMRTSETPDTAANACVDILTQLNCGTYSDDDDSELTFYIADADRFTMNVTGTYRGVSVDTVFYFNPCHQNCMAAVTLDTLDADQQKICEIPRQGKPECLFGEGAHSMTLVRADGGSIVIRTSGQETALSRVDEEQE